MVSKLSSAPFAEPLWSTRGQSPFFSDKHHHFRKVVRAYMDEHILPFCQEWEEKGAIPPEVKWLIRQRV